MPRIFKRGDVWFAWVPKPGGGTRKVSTQCTDKTAAQYRAGELEREAVDPAYAAASKTSTADACDEYLRSRIRRGRAEGTLHFYGVKLGHAVRLLPERLADVDAAACERFIETRREEGAGNAIKKEIGAIRSMLRHAQRSGLYMRDPGAVIPELEDNYVPKDRFLMPLELVALVNALAPERAAHVVFIVATGARWGESLRARRKDVVGQMVDIHGTKTRKAATAAPVPVPPPMRGALAWALANAPGPDRLFSSWSNVRRDLGLACAQIGIAPVTPNDLRRTFGSWLRISGVSTDLIGSMMRHTDSRMAERVYGRIKPADLDVLISERNPALDTGSTEKESRALGLLMGGDRAKPGVFGVPAETLVSHETPCFPVPRDGIEPPTRGFSIPSESRETAGDVMDSGKSWAANGLPFRARALRWLTTERAA